MKYIYGIALISYLIACSGADDSWVALILAGIFLAVAQITGDKIIQDLEGGEEE